MNYYFTYPVTVIGIVYGWWCGICQAVHYYPEDCPYDDMDCSEEEEYYYSLN